MVYKPGKLLPKLYRPTFLASFLARVRLKRARRLLVERGCRKVILYLWRPEYAEALDLINPDLTCYHIDDEYNFSSFEQPMCESEALLLARVDQVFIHSRSLFEKKGHLNPHTRFVPNGVDYHAYATPVAEPEDLVTIPHPRIGYTGVLKRQLDWPLIFSLVQHHPELSFIFVGPHSPDPKTLANIAELTQRPNVYFLGPKSVDDLAAYPQHFDVCIMPYIADAYTKYINPLKLHEYLASGRPVVGTEIRPLYEFVDMVALANTPEEWSTAISNALDSELNTVEHRIRRQTVARKHDWDKLVEEIAKTMAERLGLDQPISRSLHL
jgi:glycosyltransferase involved in cell wall biosynthesis